MHLQKWNMSISKKRRESRKECTGGAKKKSQGLVGSPVIKEITVQKNKKIYQL